jgi:hypothetical protein
MHVMTEPGHLELIIDHVHVDKLPHSTVILQRASSTPTRAVALPPTVPRATKTRFGLLG